MRPFACIFLFAGYLPWLLVVDGSTTTAAEPTKRVVKNIEGWQVSVDPEMLHDENLEIGNEALKALANHLQRVKYIVPEDRVTELQTLRIWIDWNHTLGNMQYHPSRSWLEKNGHDRSHQPFLQPRASGRLLL